MTTYIVDVQFDSGSNKLSIQNPDPIALQSGDQVLWKFINIPQGFTPEVDFQAQGQPFGPFQGIHVQIGMENQVTLMGEGSVGGDAASYNCRPVIGRWMTDKDEVVYESTNTITLNQQAGVPVTPKEVQVRVFPGASKIEASPESVQIFSGDVVVWNFSFDDPAEASGYRPVVSFKGIPLLPAALSPTGPFQDLAFAMVDEGDIRFRAIGSGNNEIVGDYYYVVGVERADETGARIFVVTDPTVTDPVIDNSGPPPGLAATEIRTAEAA